MLWHGLFAGATQALSCTLPVKFANVSVTVAYPFPFVTALPALSEPDPWSIKKSTVTPLFATPWLTTRAVRDTVTVAPEAIHRYGVVTPMSVDEDVASRVV